MKRKLTMILMMLGVSIGFGLAGVQSANAAAGEKIAFTSTRDGNEEIYVMNADGSNPTRLTNNAAGDSQPSFSPDGSKIAFTSLRDGNNFEIYVMNADGSNQMRLTNNAAFDSDPSFSPDGSKIAFYSSRDGNDEIYVMNSDGSNQTNLTNNAASDREPSFSPDGSKIAFTSNRDFNSEIYVMNADGTNQTRLTNNAARDVDPSFSPDGSKIAFTSLRDGNREIYVMNADGSNQTRLTNNAAFDVEPSFSPDGSKIAFHSDRDGNLEIYVMNADGSNQTNLTNNAATDVEPSWGAQADGDGDGIGDACDNTAPSISATNLTRTASNPASNSPIATVNDLEDAENTLTVTATLASGSGVTITGINTDSGGNVTANVAASCTATTSTFNLTVTDSGTLTAAATLTINVTANQLPTLSYAANPGTVFGTGLSLNPLTGPSDDVAVTGVTVQNITPSVSGFTVNSAGVVTVANNVPAGSYTVTIRATDACGFKDASFSLFIAKASPVITWSNPADITYGTTLSSSQLNATANVAGAFNYTPASGAVLNAGAGQALSVNFTPTDTTNYNAATKTATINVGKAAPAITWNNPADIVYGTALSSTQLNATANVAGTFTYTPATGTVINAGAGQTLSVTFTPTDTANYNAAPQSVTINVVKATAVLTWSNPANITYGTALSATQLNVTANVSGTFTYTPAAGTVLNAGNGQTLSVNFTPSDTANFNASSRSVVINVAKATPVIMWNNPVNITCNTPLSATQLNATANVAGSFVYTPPAGTILSLGSGQTLAVNFTPTNTANYNPVSRSVTINVLDTTAPTLTLKANLTFWPPDHMYRSISMSQMVQSVSDGCSTTLGMGNVVIEKVTSDEPDDVAGDNDGITTNDIVIAADCKSVQLRAERNETLNGRVYVITLRVKDASGNTTKKDFKVSVPISQNGTVAVQDATAQTKTSVCP